MIKYNFSFITVILLFFSSNIIFAQDKNNYEVSFKSISFPSKLEENKIISEPVTFKETFFNDNEKSLSSNTKKKSEFIGDVLVSSGSRDLNGYSMKADIFPKVLFQKLSGVGGCFNEIGCLEFQKLSEKKRLQIMQKLFSSEGANFSFCRTALGSSDFGKTAYSYDDFADDYDMEHFSVKRDLKSIVPSIREAYIVNPKLKMFASPWSPPFWMKVSKKMVGNDFQKEAFYENTMIDSPKIKKAYALYISKYIKEYKKYGVTINRLCPQNETDADTKYPSNVMSTSFMSDFIKRYLYPIFLEEDIKTEIWAGTFRVAKYKKGHFEAIKIINDNHLFKYISGLGVQYTAPKYLNDLRQARSGLKLMHTEGNCYNGKNTNSQAKSRLEEVAGYINAGVENYAYWNIFLDKRQESGWGWKQNSLITIDAENEKVIYNPDFKVISLISKTLQPGDIRCANFISSGDPIISVLSPNGNLKVLIQNNSKKDIKFRLSISEQEFHYLELPANSLNSILLKRINSN